MKEINLEEILAKWISYNLQQLGKGKEASDAVAKSSIEGGSHWYILEAMKEACKQVIELAAENATTLEDDDPDMVFYTVNKQSILNTINQIK